MADFNGKHHKTLQKASDSLKEEPPVRNARFVGQGKCLCKEPSPLACFCCATLAARERSSAFLMDVSMQSSFTKTVVLSAHTVVPGTLIKWLQNAEMTVQSEFQTYT